MAWYFIAGFISGAVGVLLLLSYIGKKMEEHKSEIQREDRREKTGEQN